LALERLMDGEPNLSALACDLGFTSHSHLTSVFRRTFGTTPSGFRGLPASKNLKASPGPRPKVLVEEWPFTGTQSGRQNGKPKRCLADPARVDAELECNRAASPTHGYPGRNPD
jgi:hypothetical protein